jgi:hypothetical protein
MKRTLFCAFAIALCAAWAQPQKKGPLSPPAETTVTIAGKNISIKYSAPSMRGRKIFGEEGIIRKDPTWPVWRAGANAATAFHTDADLTIGSLNVPAGDYTLFVLPETGKWQLIVNKQTKQWGLSYAQAQDLGRVPMTTTKAPSPIETFYIKLSQAGSNKGKLEMGWEDVVASVDFTVK